MAGYYSCCRAKAVSWVKGRPRRPSTARARGQASWEQRRALRRRPSSTQTTARKALRRTGGRGLLRTSGQALVQPEYFRAWPYVLLRASAHESSSAHGQRPLLPPARLDSRPSCGSHTATVTFLFPFTPFVPQRLSVPALYLHPPHGMRSLAVLLVFHPCSYSPSFPRTPRKEQERENKERIRK